MNATDTRPSAARFVPERRVIVSIDLAGFARLFQTHEDSELAAFVDEYYARCQVRIEERQGAVIKFMGDGCFAVFAADRALPALEAVGAIGRDVAELARHFELDVTLGASVHLASVVDQEFGQGALRRRDLLGRGVNQTFLLGRGPGVRISEPVYRSLPSAARSAWTRHKPPAIYTLTGPGELLGALGREAGFNTGRW